MVRYGSAQIAAKNHSGQKSIVVMGILSAQNVKPQILNGSPAQTNAQSLKNYNEQ